MIPHRTYLADVSRPALVLDDNNRGDLGLVRSLGFAGVPVHLAASDPRSVTSSSRYVTAVHPYPEPNASDEEKIAAIRALAGRLPARPVAFVAGDRHVRFLNRCRDALQDVLDHDLASQSVIADCVEKDRFARVATALGLPVPPSFAPTSAQDVRDRARDLTYPVFVKPASKDDWERLPKGTVGDPKWERFNTDDQLIRLFDVLELHGAHRTVIQAFVPGDDSEHLSIHVYVTPEGQPVGAFSASKPRIWPPHRGLGTQVLSRRLPEVIKTAYDVLGRLNYTGFAILQFKRDAVSRVPILLEINCRYSTWTELPSRCGANFPAVAYAVMTGQAPPPVTQRENISWLDFERDYAAFRRYRALGEWTWPRYLASYRSVRYWAFFAWDDPMPFIREIARRLT